jgi:hypothetical protein
MASREISSHRQATGSTVVIPWCAHEHSPAPRQIVTSVAGGATLLRCGGALAACQVPPDKRDFD